MNQQLSKYRLFLTLPLLAVPCLPLACRDGDPCDPGQDLIGTFCYDHASGGAASGGATSDAGAAQAEAGANEGGAPQESGNNPNATFGTPCTDVSQCGGPAPICVPAPLNYCSQLDCHDGEANAGVCPAKWTCYKYLDNPWTCVNL
jgi:hypothetical protein